MNRLGNAIKQRDAAREEALLSAEKLNKLQARSTVILFPHASDTPKSPHSAETLCFSAERTGVWCVTLKLWHRKVCYSLPCSGKMQQRSQALLHCLCRRRTSTRACCKLRRRPRPRRPRRRRRRTPLPGIRPSPVVPASQVGGRSHASTPHHAGAWRMTPLVAQQAAPSVPTGAWTASHDEHHARCETGKACKIVALRHAAVTTASHPRPCPGEGTT